MLPFDAKLLEYLDEHHPELAKEMRELHAGKRKMLTMTAETMKTLQEAAKAVKEMK